jgi:guanylate kinase
MEKASNTFMVSISSTTRAPRPNEVDGVDYNFIKTKEEFLAEVAAGKFLIHNEINGSLYGVPTRFLDEAAK